MIIQKLNVDSYCLTKLERPRERGTVASGCTPQLMGYKVELVQVRVAVAVHMSADFKTAKDGASN